MVTEPTERVGTRPMFENQRARTWDPAPEPGESLPGLAHRLVYFHPVESGGLIRFADPDRPEGNRGVSLQDDEVRFWQVKPARKVDHHLTRPCQKTGLPLHWTAEHNGVYGDTHQGGSTSWLGIDWLTANGN